MTDREKLVGLIQDSVEGCAEYWAGRIADHLIAHGVTVREMQKPLTLQEAKERKTVWLDCDDGFCDDVPFPSLYMYRGYPHHSVFIAPQNEDDKLWLDDEEYGETWRCWAEKPTEEERKAAEWL